MRTCFMIKAVILDLDDTLCLTEAACFEMENEVLRAMGRREMSREIHKATWGKKLFEAIEDRSPGIDTIEFRMAYAPIIRKYTEEGKLDALPEENYSALDELILMGKQLVVLTSRTHGELEHLLAPDHHLAERVETFYYEENMQYHKPDPRAFEHIEREHGWKPDECVYVGDSLSDAQAAKDAGLHFIASLEGGLRTEANFLKQPDAPVDVFITRFPDVIDAVQRLDLAA